MKKNGFTLIELIATIALIAVLGVVASGIIVGSLSGAKEDISKIQEKLIIGAAKSYVIDNGCVSSCSISVETLIAEGYIDESENVTGSVYVTVDANGKYKYNISPTFELNATADMASPTNSAFARAIRDYPDGSTVVLQNGTFEVSLYDTYYIPKNLTIVAGENAVVKSIGFADSSKVVEGLTLSNITFSNGKGVYSERSFKNLTINNCTFEDGASIRIGMGANAASRTNENVTIRKNNFSGSLESYSHIQIANAIGTTTVESNDIKDGRNSVQFSSVSGTANVRNNTIADSSDAAFRIGVVSENTNINISGNTISNAIKSSTGAIARIGSDSDLPASSRIYITNNTYDGVAWPNTTWSNIQGEFGINAAGEQIES